MDIKDYVKKYNLSFDKVKSEFDADFTSLYESEKNWLENLEDKVHLLKNEKDQAQVTDVINKLKSSESFNENDSKTLSTFVSKVNTIVRIANRINNFKEGTVLDNGSTLNLYDFFNSVKTSDNLSEFNYPLNSNLTNFLPHIYSVIKHCQNPTEYPIYYKYWKNILREVLSKEEDYDSMCTFYRSFPSSNRHLNFATYLGTIGIQIAKNIDSSGIQISIDSKEYKYLTQDVINIDRYNSILDTQLNIKNESSISFYDTLLSVKSKAEEVGFKFNSFTKKSRYVWIKDQQSIIGNKIAHYEIIARRNKVFVEIHFEDSKNHNFFHSQISQLPENLKWFKWNKGGQSIRFTEYKIEEKDLDHKLLNDLINFDKLIGDKIRSLIINISNNMESNCKKEFIQWLCKNPKAEYWNNDQNKIGEALDTYNNYFTSNIFNVNGVNFEKISTEITKTLYNEERNDFLDFSSKDSNHRPRAILGNRNYLKFIREKFSSNQTYKSEELPLNTILYGPPGTGKTYNTILRAAEIIENRKIDTYDEALEIFKDNLHDQIEFITFHQNYSYEDFIQGLRPETDNKSSLVFDKKDGVFKKIADKALENLKLIQKAPAELSSEAKFDKALELFSDKILESEDKFKINDTAYIFEVEEDAFRYTGEKWTNHANGLRMKFTDLKEFYRNNVKSRKDIKGLSSISGLANQHATYYYLVFAEIIKLLPKKAEEPKKVTRKNFVIIIDEINRANISRVFGELITLIEPDKRSHGSIPLEARLPSGDPFIVPSNLFIIGTMNTADKSIALLDIALRRRFEFESMYPKYEITGQEIYDVEILKKINEQIIKSKGHDFQIGHAYFMGDNKGLVQRMNKKVIPLLLEYYMNDEKEVKGILNSAGLIIEENSWPLKISGKND